MLICAERCVSLQFNTYFYTLKSNSSSKEIPQCGLTDKVLWFKHLTNLEYLKKSCVDSKCVHYHMQD